MFEKSGFHCGYFETSHTLCIVNRGGGGGNGYETRQSSLLYVVVLFFGFDPAQNISS